MEQNQLYPVFLKVSQLNILIVGGGNVGHEKLQFLLKSSPTAQVEMVATEFGQAAQALCKSAGIKMHQQAYTKELLQGRQLIIAATDSYAVNKQVYADAKAANILINVADTPELCDFYLGGVVTKGNVKIAISTNGKSPTLAKRLRQMLEEVLPDNLNAVAENLNALRDRMKGNFQEKVNNLNELTQGLVAKNKEKDNG